MLPVPPLLTKGMLSKGEAWKGGLSEFWSPRTQQSLLPESMTEGWM